MVIEKECKREWAIMTLLVLLVNPNINATDFGIFLHCPGCKTIKFLAYQHFYLNVSLKALLNYIVFVDFFKRKIKLNSFLLQVKTGLNFFVYHFYQLVLIRHTRVV